MKEGRRKGNKEGRRKGEKVGWGEGKEEDRVREVAMERERRADRQTQTGQE